MSSRAAFARALAFSGAMLSIIGTSPQARSQEASKKPLAEALFQDGRDLLAAGRTQEACAKFAMSQEVEPKLGTLLNLASCHEAEGKTASAWAEFTEARVQAARANQTERAQFAATRARELAPQLARLSISSSTKGPITVEIDGVSVDGAVLGTAFPVDPGSHRLVVTAVGKKPWKHEVTVPPGPGTTAVELPPLEDAERPDPAIAAPASTAPPVAPPSAPPAPPSSINAPAWISVSGGALALAAGSYFGFRAFDKKAEGEVLCDGRQCDQAGLDLLDEAELSAHVSTVSFAIGLAAVAIGVYLFTRPEPAAPSASRSALRPLLGARGAGVTW